MEFRTKEELAALARTDLDEVAAGYGVDEPKKYPNKDSLVDAIMATEEYRRAASEAQGEAAAGAGGDSAGAGVITNRLEETSRTNPTPTNPVAPVAPAEGKFSQEIDLPREFIHEGTRFGPGKVTITDQRIFDDLTGAVAYHERSIAEAESAEGAVGPLVTARSSRLREGAGG